MPAFKPAYLVLGDDHGRISERRAKLRALAEAESGASGVEVLEGDLCTAEEVVNALSTMTFALGRRFVIADGVERWKDADAEAVAAAMKGMDGETLTLAMFGREEGRAKVPDGLRAAVEAAGGAIAEESGDQALGAAELAAAPAPASSASSSTRPAPARWSPTSASASSGSCASSRSSRSSTAPAPRSAPRRSTSRAPPRRERKAWTLADAILAGDEKAAMRSLVELRGQGERLPGLLYQIVRRLQDAVAVAEALAAGQPPAQVRKTLRMPPSVAAERFMADVAKRDVDAFRRALEIMADLELESRGGGASGGALDEDTQAVRAVVAASGLGGGGGLARTAGS